MTMAQLKRSLQHIRTVWQQHAVNGTVSAASFATIAPSLEHDASILALNVSSLPIPLLHQHIPLLLDVLDAVHDSSPPSPSSTPSLLLRSLLTLILQWAVHASAFVASVDPALPLYPSLADLLAEGYTRAASISEQFIAALTLPWPTESPPSPLLPALFAVLALCLSHLSTATAHHSLSLLLAHLRLPPLARLVVRSPHLPPLVGALARGVPAVEERVAEVTTAVLDLWRAAASESSPAPLPPYAHHASVLSFVALIATERKDGNVAARLLSCIRGHQRLLDASAPSTQPISLIPLFALLGLLQTVDPKAALTRARRASSDPSALPDQPLVLAGVVDDTEAVLHRLLQSVPVEDAGSLTPPAYSATFEGVLSAALVYATPYMSYSADSFRLLTRAFLTLIDTRWCTQPPASSPAAYRQHDQAIAEWTRSPHFGLLAYYSRTFSTAFLLAAPETQTEALHRLHTSVKAIHAAWRRYNSAVVPPSKDRSRSHVVAPLTDEDGEEEEEDDEEKPVPPPPPPPTSPLPPLEVTEVQKVLFMSVCMALASISRGGWLRDAAVPQVCEVIDALSWLEFCRVSFSGYRDVVVAIVEQGVAKQSSAEEAKEAAGGGRRRGWLSWLLGWGRRQRVAGDTTVKADRSSVIVQHFLNQHLVPSLPARPFASESSPLSALLLVDGLDLVSLSRHFFVLDLLTVWTGSVPPSLLASIAVPYAASFLALPIRGVQKRAHALVTRSCASLASTSQSSAEYAAFLRVWPAYVEQLVEMYPSGVAFAVVMDSLVLMYHLLPSDHPLLLDASAALCAKLRTMTRDCVESARNSGIRGTYALPTLLRHLLILHLQLVQLLDLPSFVRALGMTATLFEEGKGEGEEDAGVWEREAVNVELLVLMQQVIARNFDLYRRDAAVRWWMQQKALLGVRLPMSEAQSSQQHESAVAQQQKQQQTPVTGATSSR